MVLDSPNGIGLVLVAISRISIHFLGYNPRKETMHFPAIIRICTSESAHSPGYNKTLSWEYTWESGHFPGVKSTESYHFPRIIPQKVFCAKKLNLKKKKTFTSSSFFLYTKIITDMNI